MLKEIGFHFSVINKYNGRETKICHQMPRKALMLNETFDATKLIQRAKTRYCQMLDIPKEWLMGI
jgi:hypothetical protein